MKLMGRHAFQNHPEVSNEGELLVVAHIEAGEEMAVSGRVELHGGHGFPTAPESLRRVSYRSVEDRA